jgi:glycosyltransferase involved in cell wall biosynthesis
MTGGVTVKILIMIPAFNEAATIAQVINSLPSELDGFGATEVLVIDDGSSDGTADAARAAGAIVVRHARNRGVGAAFQTGHQVALERGADLLVSIDADGQFDPAEIQALLVPLQAGQAGMVTGCRFGPSGRPANMPRVKYWGNLIVAAIVRSASGVDLRDVSCGFRAYSREALLHLNLFGKFTYTQETILDLAFKNIPITEVPVTVHYFSDRRSRVAGSIFRYAMNAGKITNGNSDCFQNGFV